jgi:hypothetical protein
MRASRISLGKIGRYHHQNLEGEQYTKSVSLPKTRSERIDVVVRQGSDTR